MVLAPGSYYLEVEDNNGCEVESDTITFNDHSTSIDLLSDLKMNIYPNPFIEYTTVDFGIIISKGEVRLMDILGNLVDIYQLQDQKELIIEKGTKSKGVYFVELTVNDNKNENKSICKDPRSLKYI